MFLIFINQFLKMSLQKRKIKDLAPLQTSQKRQSLPKNTLKLKKLEIPKPIPKVQPRKLKLTPFRTSAESLKPRPFQNFQKFESEKEQKPMRDTFMTQSSLFTSFYNTQTAGWIKPSDYIVEISELGLLDEADTGDDFEFRLNDSAKKNSEKIERLCTLISKWVLILKKAIFYTSSQRTNSDKLSEQMKFWKVLSKKFDQLEYEFNDQKIQKLLKLIDHYSTIKPEHNALFNSFISLKQEVCSLTISIKKLHLTLEQTVQPLVAEFQESESVCGSIELIRQILSNLHSVFQNFKIIEGRKVIIYRKLNLSFVRCLVASNINPNNLKDNADLMDPSLSFLSNFISLLEQESIFSQSQIMQKAEYQQQVMVTLLQMSMLFQHCEKQKVSLDLISKIKDIRSMDYTFNMFDQQNNDRWFQSVKLFDEAKDMCELFRN